MADPRFGRFPTDHMVTMSFNEARGWHDGELSPRRRFQLDPTTLVFHYAQEIFEGLKAYRQPDGGVALFRPEANARRFANSARRLAMPPLPEGLFVEAVQDLVRLDQDWVPPTEQGSLYLRPFMIASEAVLGVKPSTEYLFCVVASPVGAYFAGGSEAISLWVSQEFTRAAPGGTGEAKCGGNYAASLAAQAEAARNGCDQVVFLDSVEKTWVEELGGMNIFFVFDDRTLLTPPLGGTILPGITRDSLIHLARDLGMEVREEPYSIEDFKADASSGRLSEAFACGTAAVVTPIGTLRGPDYDRLIGGGAPGPVTESLRKALLGIQTGTAPDPRGWRRRVV